MANTQAPSNTIINNTINESVLNNTNSESNINNTISPTETLYTPQQYATFIIPWIVFLVLILMYLGAVLVHSGPNRDDY